MAARSPLRCAFLSIGLNRGCAITLSVTHHDEALRQSQANGWPYFVNLQIHGNPRHQDSTNLLHLSAAESSYTDTDFSLLTESGVTRRLHGCEALSAGHSTNRSGAASGREADDREPQQPASSRHGFFISMNFSASGKPAQHGFQ